MGKELTQEEINDLMIELWGLTFPNDFVAELEEKKDIQTEIPFL